MGQWLPNKVRSDCHGTDTPLIFQVHLTAPAHRANQRAGHVEVHGGVLPERLEAEHQAARPGNQQTTGQHAVKDRRDRQLKKNRDDLR